MSVPENTAAAAVVGPLSWAPPAGYANFPVKSPTSTTSLNIVDGGGRDVLIKLPRDKAIAPLTIRNCRNAVMIGGAIKVLPVEELSGNDQRAVYVANCSGTVHLEGLFIDGNVSGSTADAIAINAPNAIVQMQNINASGMKGSSNNHADVVQPWGGVREYRIDRMTGSTNYQGLHVPEEAGRVIGQGIIRNANIFSSGVQADGKGGQYIWLPSNNEYPVTLEGVFISGRPGDSFNRSIWPNTSNPTCPASITAPPVARSPRGPVAPGSPAMSRRASLPAGLSSGQLRRPELHLPRLPLTPTRKCSVLVTHPNSPPKAAGRAVERVSPDRGERLGRTCWADVHGSSGRTDRR